MFSIQTPARSLQSSLNRNKNDDQASPKWKKEKEKEKVYETPLFVNIMGTTLRTSHSLYITTLFSFSPSPPPLHLDKPFYNFALPPSLASSSLANLSFNCRLKIFPAALLGISSTNLTPPLKRL